MRRRLNRELIARAALDVLDEGGTDALTMRRVARVLEVDPMALYRHVDDRRALDDLAAEQVLAEALTEISTRPAPTKRSWRRAVHDVADAVTSSVDRHPAAAAVLAAQPPLGPASLELFARVVGCLRLSGASAQDVAAAAQTLVALTFAAAAPGRRPTERRASARVDAVRAHLHEHSPELADLAPHVAEVVPLRTAVDLVLDGLRSRSPFTRST
ncbi:MAG: TetR/AcrR family transcriptional regulator C-terminal domain-containing protein [Dermatophilaceae bacterium]